MRPKNDSDGCEVCGGYAEAGDYCFAVYLHNPDADNADEVRPPDAYVHARNEPTARRVLLNDGNEGILTSPFGMTNIWDLDYPRKRLPAKIKLYQQPNF